MSPAAEPAAHAPAWIRDIAPYVPGKPIEELARELGLDPASIVKLASNENPRGPGPRVLAAIAAAAADATRYPDGTGFVLRQALARRHGVRPESLVLGNGSNDILELVTQAFLTPGDEAVYAEHAFAVYPLATHARGAKGVVVPAREYGHDLDAMAAAIGPRTRVVFVANPNNPTGTWLEPAAIERFVGRIPREVVVVLDEAYDEYLPAADRSRAVALVAKHPNLLVSRTFSKAYGLAALRIGYAIADPSVADLMNRVRQPFNVNALAQAAAVAALEDVDYVEESARLNREGMGRLEEGFRALGLRFIRSHGNFVLVHVGDGAAVYAALLRDGVIVRPVAGYGLPAWLRVTVGLASENTRFLDALARALPASRAGA
ncbi:MAG: histidinol-phosphate transaminase [Burkholderiales bacterium]